MPKVFLNKRTLSTKTAFATLIAEFVLKTPHINRSRYFSSATFGLIFFRTKRIGRTRLPHFGNPHPRSRADASRCSTRA